MSEEIQESALWYILGCGLMWIILLFYSTSIPLLHIHRNCDAELH